MFAPNNNTLQQLYAIPPNKLWYILVYNPPAESAKSEKSRYDSLMEERNALTGMLAGLKYVIKTFANPLNLDYLITLHDIATRDVATVFNYSGENSDIEKFYSPIQAGIRSTPVSFGLSEHTLTQKGLENILNKIARQDKGLTLRRVSEPTPVTVPSIDPKVISTLAKQLYYAICHEPYMVESTKTTWQIQNDVTAAINYFYQQISHPQNCRRYRYAPNEPLTRLGIEIITHICELIHELEIIHPFEDGNCRTFGVLLLIKLLLQYDLGLSFLDDPNIIDGHDKSEIANTVYLNMSSISNLSQIQLSVAMPYLYSPFSILDYFKS